MRLVPDHFFCVLSTLLDSLSPEEIGSPFSAKSRFVQRVRSSLPVACGIWMACPPPLPPESGVYARVQAKIKVGDQRVNGCVRACLKSCEHYCLPTGVAWQRGGFFIFFPLRCMGLIGAERSPSTPSHSQVQDTARLHIAHPLGPTMAETRNGMFRRASEHHPTLKYNSIMHASPTPHPCTLIH